MPKRWGRRDLEDDVWTLALARTESAFERFDHCFVSFSGGKDSTVVLNAALVVAEKLGRLPLRVVFCDEEAIPYETEDYCRRVAQDPRVALEWYCLPVQHRNACSRESPHWWPWAPEAEHLWTRPLPPEAITAVEGFPINPPEARPTWPQTPGLLCPADRYGSVAMLMGIRADESLTRRRAVANDRAENWVFHAPDTGPNCYKVYPIYDMTTEDVWTAAHHFGWDYNVSYDLMEMAGMNHKAQRCAPPYGEQPMRGLWVFKECFPDLWDKMVHRVPGAATAARYATTDLYAFGGVPDRPAGVTWQELIRRRIEEYDDPEIRSFIAHRIQADLKGHHRKTTDPVVDVPHHETGVSWPYLYKIADRGDLKSRSWPEFGKSTAEQYQAARERYEAELAMEGLSA